MFARVDETKLCFILVLTPFSMGNNPLFLDTNEPEKDLADFILSKGYLPKDDELPKPGVKKSEANDVTYLLSKLSDEELVKLLSTYPKKTEYNLNDIVKIASNATSLREKSDDKVSSRFKTVPSEPKAFFKLDNKPVFTNDNNIKNKADPVEGATHKLKNILYSRPVEQDDSKKEILFDVLVNQLKTLCCKKKKITKKIITKPKLLRPLLTDFTSRVKQTGEPPGPTKFMFLIINDDIPTNNYDKDGLISVDPESLDEKSSVLLLGPIYQTLTNVQLKLVMTRITNELSRSEYLPLLQQIADGNLDPENMKIMKSLVTGPDTRRYIKPHRCNYQSKLAKVYGGPRWIICMGYLNLNTPSLYDK